MSDYSRLMELKWRDPQSVSILSDKRRRLGSSFRRLDNHHGDSIDVRIARRGYRGVLTIEHHKDGLTFMLTIGTDRRLEPRPTKSLNHSPDLSKALLAD
ncbi:MAG: hypothetical protein EOR40_24780 [Mesorhizobium sp.]|nr:MAG: hypothetical protein EOR40_24780 [Mesorhizobium sp.]